MRALILVVFALAACGKSETKRCEHARDVFVGMQLKSTDELLRTMDPAHRAELEARANAETERVRTRFVARCKELPKAGKACIARIDELAAAERDRRAAVARCRRAAGPGELPDGDCEESANEAFETKVGSCMAELGPMLDEIAEP